MAICRRRAGRAPRQISGRGPTGRALRASRVRDGWSSGRGVDLTLLDRLRAATADLHAAVERESGLMDEHLSLEDYAAILGRLHAFHGCVEPAVQDALDEAMMAPRRRLAAIDRDLRRLGAAPSPLRTDPPALPDQASGLGALYVLDGSRLGARVVAAAIAQRLGSGRRAALPISRWTTRPPSASGATRWTGSPRCRPEPPPPPRPGRSPPSKRSAGPSAMSAKEARDAGSPRRSDGLRPRTDPDPGLDPAARRADRALRAGPPDRRRQRQCRTRLRPRALRPPRAAPA